MDATFGQLVSSYNEHMSEADWTRLEVAVYYKGELLFSSVEQVEVIVPNLKFGC